MSRSQWVDDEVMRHILAALMPENRLAIITSLVTGLRIGDVLSLRTSELQKDRFSIREEKTLKRREVRLPRWLREKLLSIAGKVYIFEGRNSALAHRTRQAVYKDIKRAAKAFRVAVNVSPHSARKIYAVAEYKRDMNIQRVKKLLNHDNEAVTLIYALADEITKRDGKRKGRP